MQWSKLKKLIEERFAERVKGHVQVGLTVYRNSSPCSCCDYGRGWLRIDGDEIYSFCTLKANVTEYDLGQELKKVNNSKSDIDEVQQLRYKKGIYTKYEFVNSLENYLMLTIDEAMVSSNPIIRGISMIDRRLGKRRLSELRLQRESHALVKRLKEFRCTLEFATNTTKKAA